MTATQIPIDWEKSLHVRENSARNEKHLHGNHFHFKGQVATVLTWLQKGYKITSVFAAKNEISDLQRRIGDLGEFCSIDIDREYLIKDDGKKSRLLVYFLPENRKEFIEKKWIVDSLRTWYSDKYTPTDVIKKIKNKNI